MDDPSQNQHHDDHQDQEQHDTNESETSNDDPVNRILQVMQDQGEWFVDHILKTCKFGETIYELYDQGTPFFTKELLRSISDQLKTVKPGDVIKWTNLKGEEVSEVNSQGSICTGDHECELEYEMRQ